MVLRELERGSSEIDWCEQNYIISASIAEFYNTISNILFLVMPPMLMYLFRAYNARFGPSPNLVWGLLVVVGLGSIYFHATLSHVGQLLDELAILWVIIAAYAIWWPTRFLPFGSQRPLFQGILFLITLFCSALGCCLPAANKYALMFFAFPIIGMMFLEVQRVREQQRVVSLAWRSFATWLLAVTCWVGDKFFCVAAFPYLHSVWHVLIFLTAYSAGVLFSFFFASAECPEEKPSLRYWPSDQIECLAIPYVHFNRPTKKQYEA